MLELLTKAFTGENGQKRLMLIIIIWLILNAYLTATNHQTIAQSTALLAQMTAQCPKPPSNAELPRYVRLAA